MSNIFQIKSEYLQIVDKLQNNDGELTPELETALAINKDELQEKSINYVHVIKTIKSENDFIASEIKRLQALKKVREQSIERLENSIADAMNLYELDEITTPLIKINFRKSKKTIIDNIELLPNDCIIIEKKAFHLLKLKNVLNQEN